MMRMLPLNALLFGRYENAADDEKKKTKKKIHHDDTNNIPKTPLLLLSSSFCQRKRKPEQQRRLLKRASRENEKRKVVCREVVFLCVFANLIDFFLLSFFCSSIKLERKSTLLDRHRRFRDRKRCLSPTRAVCEAALSSAALVGRRIRSFLNSSKLFKYCLHTQRQQYSSHAFLLFGLLASESREQHTGSTQSFESANI